MASAPPTSKCSRAARTLTAASTGERRASASPCNPGHEFVGTVVEPLARLSRAMLTAETQVSCGNCWFCTNGHKHKCDSLRIFGQGIDGAMATHLVLPQGSAIHRVPARVPAAHAVLAEPLSVSLRAVTRAKIADEGAGQLLAVSGCGPIGLGLVVGLRALAPRATVVAVDPLPSRREVALACGAHSAVDPAAANVTALLAELAPERGGCDVYFEATGASASIDTGLRALRKCGTMVLVGISSRTTASSGGAGTPSLLKGALRGRFQSGPRHVASGDCNAFGRGAGPPLPLDRLVHVHPLSHSSRASSRRWAPATRRRPSRSCLTRACARRPPRRLPVPPPPQPLERRHRLRDVDQSREDTGSEERRWLWEQGAE